ncbi:MAG: glycosyltransferase [Gammaproteobacteria bacterium]
MESVEGKLNVMLLVNSFLPSIGGREIVVHYLATALQDLGHAPRVICSGGWRKSRHLEFDYPVIRYPAFRGKFPERVRYLQLVVDTLFHQCDVIHAHATYPSGLAAVRLKRNKNIPLVVTPHGNDIHTIPELGHGLRLDPEKDKKIRMAVNQSELLTAISGSVEASLIEADAPKLKIRAIPNGVDIDRFSREKSADVLEWLGVPPSSKLIVTVGRYNPRKGQDVLIRAMPRILKAQPDSVLVIVGDNTEALRPLITDLELTDKVILTGGISPPVIVGSQDSSNELNNNDRLADLFLQSEMYVSAGVAEGAEGLSLAVLEAMASRLPVVASDISGNRDIITNRDNGFLVPPGNHEKLAEAIIEMLDSHALQQSMREKSRKVAEKYQWIEIAKMYIDVYREAIEISHRR